LVNADGEWVQANASGAQVDVVELEHAFASVRTTPGEQICEHEAEALKRVVPFYRGDLLEGCYEDWCTYERERLKAMYLSVLERLLGYCEKRGLHEEGFEYGEQLLRYEHAHERAHWRLMRLHYLAGDRTGALRQFERCKEFLHAELGIEPGEAIMALYEQLRADHGPPVRREGPLTSAGPEQVRGAGAAGTLTLPVKPLLDALEALGQAGELLEQSMRAAGLRSATDG
jgi:DNA-binding SARP family transcriptional activator